MIRLSELLSEVMWNRVDSDKISKSKMKDVKSSKVLKKLDNGDYIYYLTDYMADDIFYGQIFVFDKSGKFVGESLIAKWGGDENSKYLEASVSVHPDHRRKGIASTMYNMAERYFRKKFKPASSKTSDAEKFWKSRKS